MPSSTQNLSTRSIESGVLLPLPDKIRRLEESELSQLMSQAKLRPEFQLFLKVSDDLGVLEIGQLTKRFSEEEINGNVQVGPTDYVALAQIPNPRLLFSLSDIVRFAPAENREAIAQLYTLGRRITQYMGQNITWDQATDSRVWTTNIDTVNFLDALARDGVFAREDVRATMEIGVGGGGISKVLLGKLPSIREHIATDISAPALLCAKRNIDPILGSDQQLTLYHGKGIRDIEARVDILIVNPPYIPHLKKPDAVDPYRGTGLIREIIEHGRERLDPNNSKACIYLGMSSLGENDLNEYLAVYPGWSVTQVAERRRVPLKILTVSTDPAWLDYLVKEHGLIDSPELLKSDGFRYWHDIFVLKLSPATK